MRIDFTSLSDYMKCPTAFKYKRLDKKCRAEDSIHLEAGKAMHKGLETYYELSHLAHQERRKAALNSLREAIQASAMLRQRPSWEKKTGRNGDYESLNLMGPDHLEKTLAAYVEHYKDEKFKVVACEKHLEMEVAPGITYHGTIDMICEDENGRTFAMDHKFVSRLGIDFEHFAEPNHQATGYLALLQENGFGYVNRFVFNGIQKVDKKLETNRAECFLRVEANRNTTNFLEWSETVALVAKRIQEDVQSGIWLQASPHGCTLYNKRCEFTELCLASKETRANILASFDDDKWPGFVYDEKEKK